MSSLRDLICDALGAAPCFYSRGRVARAEIRPASFLALERTLARRERQKALSHATSQSSTPAPGSTRGTRRYSRAEDPDLGLRVLWVLDGVIPPGRVVERYDCVIQAIDDSGGVFPEGRSSTATKGAKNGRQEWEGRKGVGTPAFLNGWKHRPTKRLATMSERTIHHHVHTRSICFRQKK